MAKAGLKVEIAFSDFPTVDPASANWEDVSQYVKSVDIKRGRKDKYSDIETGTMTIVMDNLSRRFDPVENTDVKPVRRIRAFGVFQATNYPLFSGLIDVFPPNYPDFFNAEVAIDCLDVLELLISGEKLFTSYPQQTVTQRINAVLDDTGWPSGANFRNIDSSSILVQPVTLEGIEPLEHINHVIQSVFGRFYADKEGRLVYEDRLTVILNQPSSPTNIFGEDFGSGELPYFDVKFSFGKDRVFNKVRFKNIDGLAQEVEDSTSIQNYFKRTFPNRTNMLLTTDSEALDAANYVLANHKNPLLRIEEFSFSGNRSDDNMLELLQAEIGQRVDLKRRPTDGNQVFTGSVIERALIKEGIQISVSKKMWQCTYLTSPAELDQYWILEHPVFGVLGSTTRLAF